MGDDSFTQDDSPRCFPRTVKRTKLVLCAYQNWPPVATNHECLKLCDAALHGSPKETLIGGRMKDIMSLVSDRDVTERSD